MVGMLENGDSRSTYHSRPCTSALTPRWDKLQTEKCEIRIRTILTEIINISTGSNRTQKLSTTVAEVGSESSEMNPESQLTTLTATQSQTNNNLT